MEQYMWIVWLSIFVLSLIIEACTTELVSIFFTLGSIVALILSLINGIPLYWEIIAFTVLSIVSLLALRPVMKKVLDRQKRKTNVDEFIGKTVKLTKGYEEFNNGETKLNGLYWTVINVNEEEPIEEGTLVTIVSVQGNKLVVKK